MRNSNEFTPLFVHSDWNSHDYVLNSNELPPLFVLSDWSSVLNSNELLPVMVMCAGDVFTM